MKTIGLIGGVASGKSLVAKMFVELGAGLLDADRAGHQVLAEDSEVHAALRRRWGAGIFADDGSIDRSAIAKRVFGADSAVTAEREFLEGLLHPRIRARLVTLAQQMEADQVPAVVLDAPLLLEAGWDAICDIILFVDASRDVRLARALGRGWTEKQFEAREASQWPIVKKRSAADEVINNDGTQSELRQAIHCFWNRNVAAAKK